MDALHLSLVEVIPRKKRTYWYAFEESDQFVKPWWGRGSSPNISEHWLSVERDGLEVARCKFTLLPEATTHPLLGDVPHGQLDILALEVAISARDQGVGRAILQAIRSSYPLPKLTALNDDAESRGFWDSVGWIRHEPPRSFVLSERVTYSEP